MCSNQNKNKNEKQKQEHKQNTNKSNTNTNTKTKQNETKTKTKQKNEGVQHEFRHLFQQPNQFFVHRFRTQSTFPAQIPISASAVARIIVSCSKNAHARRGLQEPPGRVIAPGLSLGGYLFLRHFFDLVFSQFLSQKRPQKRAKIDEKRSRKTNQKTEVEK